MLRLIIIFTFIGSLASADTWLKLSNNEIETALSNRTLQYSGAIQVFYENGDTYYASQRPTHGKWDVEENQYCSVWPPAVTWVCYDVERNTDGTAIRFISKDGSADIGTYKDGN
ncbi:hypothetical protein F9L33_03690 [Amylibacter sp. SFDW26]|uniref:hypothetical protein n=1 Tax=Amylibacter sp. SFDW26 TaxID=2652722 RepID=UPI0012620B17|nr:hypothetical protein [Amylibacter sp. SFDW26]KAB7615874.1 hypothetical protein F9L33_03690 [Amylibacter sp. SFDW26]